MWTASHQVLHECRGSGFDPRQPELGKVRGPGALFVRAVRP